MSDDQRGASDGAPKLTIGQRLLTLLPNLQRTSGPAPTPRGGVEVGGDDVDTSDAGADAGGGAAASTRSGRGAEDTGTRPATRPTPAQAVDAMSKEELVVLIKRVDDRERSLALLAAVLGVVVGVALTVITIHTNPAARIHGKINPAHASVSLIALEGGARILLSGIVVAAAYSRRRSLIGFALLFLGTAMGAILALPFWALGGWLIWRVFKYQRVLNARGGRGGAGRGGAGRAAAGGSRAGGGRVPAGPRAAARAGSTAGRERAEVRQRGRKQPAPAGPPPSKRYTPPKPTRPRPPAPSP